MKRSAFVCLQAWLLMACCACQTVFAASSPVPPGSGTSPISREGEEGGKAQTQAISPFSGEATPGVAMLAMYGPRIFTLASAVAKRVAALGSIVNTTREPSRMAVAIGDKFETRLGLLLGPLSLSPGVVRDGIAGLDSQLLEAVKAVSGTVATSVESVQELLSRSLTMSRDVERLAGRGLDLSRRMKALADGTRKELLRILRGGEIQVFRDGAANIAARLGRQADANSGVFNQTLTNTRMTTALLEGVKDHLGRALLSSGKPARDVSLYDLGFSRAHVAKQLVDARKYLASSHGVLVSADASAGGFLPELMALLTGIEADLETFAAAREVDSAALTRAMKEVRESEGTRSHDGEIGALVDEMIRLNPRPAFKVEASGETENEPERELDSEPDLKPDSESNSESDSGTDAERKAEPAAGIGAIDRLFDGKVAAYRAFLLELAANPGDAEAVGAARAAFEKAESAFRALVAQNQ